MNVNKEFSKEGIKMDKKCLSTSLKSLAVKKMQIYLLFHFMQVRMAN